MKILNNLEHTKLPLLLLKNEIIFPNIIITLFINRKISIKTIELAFKKKTNIILTIQKRNIKEYYLKSNICNIGCISKIIQILKLPNNNIKLLIEGLKKVKIEKIIKEKNYLFVNYSKIKKEVLSKEENKAMSRIIIKNFKKYILITNKFLLKIVKYLKKIKDIDHIMNVIIYYLPISIKQKQKFLETLDVFLRHEILFEKIQNELNINKIEKKIIFKVKQQIENSQNNNLFNEQTKIINQEFMENEDPSDLYKLEKKIFSAKMSEEALEKALSEFKKLKLMPIMSSEASVIRNYIETLISLPWKKKTKINNNIKKAKKILDFDHYGLEDIKERILEYLAVQQRVNNFKGPILCFIGPPGVGKTSLGKSIARAINRNFIRISLGGIRDEAEIRGHRRTYIGSMPGKIIQNLIKAKTKNPLFLLDEIDKIGADYRGDPASALLEVLDSEQNNTFSDHFIEVDFDLSKIMFIATSNSYNIHPALLDRMEIIHLSGYTQEEKIKIFLKYLLPKQIKNNGLSKNEINISIFTIKKIINNYTKEAGVRSLERQISKICRKIVKILLLNNETKKIFVTPKNLKNFLGTPIFDRNLISKKNQIGQVNGLAWTEVGGELLTIEAVILPGEGEIISTGTLGKTMKESIDNAYTITQIILLKKGINKNIFKKNNIHINIPEGGTPKDGPSAGIAITIAMISAFTNIFVKKDIAMTGEITLRGEVLKIGGLKEKIFAAYQSKIKTVIIPEKNIKILEKISKKIKNKLKIITVNNIKEVLEISLKSKINFNKKKNK